MKSKPLSIITTFVLVVTLAVSGCVYNAMADKVPGENWGVYDPNATSTLYLSDETLANRDGQGCLNAQLSDGYLYFYYKIFADSLLGSEAIEKLFINGYGDTSSDNISDIQFKEKKTNDWSDARDAYLNNGVQRTLKNRTIYFKVKFNKDGIYTLNAAFMPPDNATLSAGIASRTRYFKIENGSVSWSKNLLDIDPNPTTTQEQTTSVQYDVDTYKANGTYPTNYNYTFAGWYADADCTVPYLENTGKAYAKYIDNSVLRVKFQWSLDNTAVRFVSSLDSKNYQEAGFIINGTYGDGIIENKRKTVKKVYLSINADGEIIKPTVFSKTDSKYFFTYTVRKMDSNTASTWSVTPFFVTPDGTEVKGDLGTDVYPHAE